MAHNNNTRQPQGNLTIYSAVAGIISAMPVPMLNEWLGDLTRGSLMRRVAQRHGIRLTPEGREELARSEIASVVHNTRVARFARGWIGHAIAPARVFGGVEDGLAALLAAVFMDFYLSKRPFAREVPIDRIEAARIRSAMLKATEGGIVALSKAAPRGIGKTLQIMGKALERASAEGRSAPERFVDAFLDAIADSPENFLAYFVERFDAALDEKPTSQESTSAEAVG